MGAVDVQLAFRTHYPSLFRYALRFSGDPDAAEDLVQEAFVRLLEQDLPDDEVRPWLFVVTGNLARDRSRKRTRRRRLLEQNAPVSDGLEPPELAAERAERIDGVRDALQKLSDRDQTILLMREEGFRYAEIAEAIGVKQTSVGALVARALRRFSAAWAAMDGADGSSE
jgi:RNA polymerase sigma-70 factor (ECF subfamily)